LGESLVVVSFWVKRVAAIVHPGQGTLKHHGHGLSKPSGSATVLENGQARDRFLAEE
jgi:hypothetical protein